ncbi:MAG: prepilin-type N-terminal cleavage/methylation domain-containing protein [Deltaproteobacteria bacterium]|nr:prepilin-type N-terminal cleavage/methylation domain-containing protein [Deltaproteobacteria bacterium]
MKTGARRDNRRRVTPASGKAPGFTLVELMIAMVVGMVVLGAIFGVFTFQSRTYDAQEEVVAMQQSVRAGMDMMVREISMAGYNPSRAPFLGVTFISGTNLLIRADINGDGATNGSLDDNECIEYKYSTDTPYLVERILHSGPVSGSGSVIPFMDNVQSLNFQGLDSAGNPTADPYSVRQIRITITGRTAKRDPAYTANGGYRTYTLTSVAVARNLAY